MYFSSRNSLLHRTQSWWIAKDNDISSGSHHLMSGHLHNNQGDLPLWHFAGHSCTMKGMIFLTPLKTSEKTRNCSHPELCLCRTKAFVDRTEIKTRKWKVPRRRAKRSRILGSNNNWPMFTLVKLSTTIPALYTIPFLLKGSSKILNSIICPSKITENVAFTKMKNQLTDTQMVGCHFIFFFKLFWNWLTVQTK